MIMCESTANAMKRKQATTWIACECGSEYLQIIPQDWDNFKEGIYLGIYTNAYHKPSFWNRFRHIWHTLIYGQPYDDQICLDYEQVKELNKFLENYIALTEVEKKHKKKYCKK